MWRSAGFEGTNLDMAHRYNRHLIIEAIRVHGSLSRAELTRLTVLAPQTVSNITASLIEAGFVLARKRSGSARGQPPVDLRLNPRGGYAFGVSIDRSKVLAILLNLVGERLGDIEIRADRTDPDHVLGETVGAVKALGARLLRPDDRVLGTGIAMTGLTTQGGFIGLAPDEATRHWRGRSFEKELGAALDMPIFTDNDARAAAIGEALYGAGRRYRDIVYLYFGTGIGGGIIESGQPFRGHHGRAGEFGHMIVRPGGLRCSCGNRGCLELYASSASALAALDAAAADDPDQELVAALGRRDPRLDAWMDTAAACLRTAIVNIENIFDPEVVLLGGILPDQLLDALYQRILPLPHSVASQRADQRDRILKSTPGPHTAAMGAASLALFDATSATASLLFKSGGRSAPAATRSPSRD